MTGGILDRGGGGSFRTFTPGSNPGRVKLSR